MRKRPTICRYMEAVGDSWHRFRTWGEVRPEYDAQGGPLFVLGTIRSSSGSVARMVGSMR